MIVYVAASAMLFVIALKCGAVVGLKVKNGYDPEIKVKDLGPQKLNPF